MRRIFSIVLALAFVAGGLLISSLGSIPNAFASATITSTITGWNVPSSGQLTNGIIPLILPMVFASFFAAIGLYFKRKGDFIVTLLLIGLAAGSTFGMLGSGGPGSSNANIALFQAILTWALAGVWIYQGAQGGPVQE